MPPQLQLLAVAFISPQNHPLLIRSFSSSKKNDLKYHYIAHTSLDVIEERSECDWHPHTSNALINMGLAGPSTKTNECYLGLLYAMEDVAVYGYMTPLKVKIVLTLALTDSVVRDADVTMVSLLCRDNMLGAHRLYLRFSEHFIWHIFMHLPIHSYALILRMMLPLPIMQLFSYKIVDAGKASDSA